MASLMAALIFLFCSLDFWDKSFHLPLSIYTDAIKLAATGKALGGLATSTSEQVIDWLFNWNGWNQCL